MDFDHLSASSLTMYQRCGMQFYYRYIEGLKRPPAIAMVAGSATHKGAESDLTNWLTTKNHLKEKEVEEISVETYKKLAEEAEGTKTEKEKEIDNVAKRTLNWYKDLRDSYPKLIAVEKEVAIRIPGAPYLLGYIDIWEEDTITDLKTSSRHKNQTDADGSMQLTIYALHHLSEKGTIPQLRLHSITTKSTREITSTRTLANIDATLKEIQEIWRAIQAGIFMPAPADSWICSERFCGYWDKCPYARR